MSNDSQLFNYEEYAQLRRHCAYKWGVDKGQNILHSAYVRALEAIIKGTYDPNFQPPGGKVRERSPLYCYVFGILQSACQDEMLASGWSKKTIKFVSEKIWEETEIPASVMSVDDNGNERGLDEYADPNTLDFESQLFQGNEVLGCRNLNVEYISEWFITEINAYVLYLRNICDYNKLFVLCALCTKNMRLKNVAEEKGLPHENMTRVVSKIYDDLANRTGIPINRIRDGIDIIRAEKTLSSQLIIQEVLNVFNNSRTNYR
jgi:hypothetical protein